VAVCYFPQFKFTPKNGSVKLKLSISGKKRDSDFSTQQVLAKQRQRPRDNQTSNPRRIIKMKLRSTCSAVVSRPRNQEIVAHVHIIVYQRRFFLLLFSIRKWKMYCWWRSSITAQALPRRTTLKYFANSPNLIETNFKAEVSW